VIARQVLYHLSHTPSFLVLNHILDQVYHRDPKLSITRLWTLYLEKIFYLKEFSGRTGTWEYISQHRDKDTAQDWESRAGANGGGGTYLVWFGCCSCTVWTCFFYPQGQTCYWPLWGKQLSQLGYRTSSLSHECLVSIRYPPRTRTGTTWIVPLKPVKVGTNIPPNFSFFWVHTIIRTVADLINIKRKGVWSFTM
jgi:hypothetical protein